MVALERVEKLFKEKEKKILEAWIKNQLASTSGRSKLIPEGKLREESIKFIDEFVRVIRLGNIEDISSNEYEEIKKHLQKLSRSRSVLGFSPSETASYIFSLKAALNSFMQEAYKDDPQKLTEDVVRINELLDKLGLFTFEEYMKGKEEIIREQSVSLLELSSPIVTLWESVLAVPVIGILDSKRTQVIMEDLLKKIVESGSRIAIIDITGVGIVDTQVANHLIKTVSAVKLLGAEAIVTGIRPEVAQTIVTLGVELGSVITKSSLADGLKYAFKELQYKVEKI